MLAAASLAAAVSVLLSYWASPVVVVGLLAATGGFLMAQRARTGVLVLLLLSLPLGRLTVAQLGPVPVSPVTALVFALVGLWLWQVLTDRENIEFSWMQLSLAGFLLSGAIGLSGASDVVLGTKTLFIFVMGAAVYLVTAQTLRSVEEARGVVWAVAGATGAVGVYAILAGTGALGNVSDARGYDGQSYDGVEGLFTHVNGLAGFLALSIPPVVALVVSEPLRRRRVLGFLLLAAATAGLVLTYSRGAWIGTIIAVLVLLLVLRKGVQLAWGIVLTGAFLASGAVLERLQSITTVESDSAVTSRFEFWGVALRMVTDHPLLGVGLGNFQTAYEDLMFSGLPLLPYTLEVPNQAHNLFLHLAVEVGLVGLAAFTWILAVAFVQARRVHRSADPQAKALGLGVAAGLVALLVHNLVDVTIYQGFSAILFFAYLGVLDGLGRNIGK